MSQASAPAETPNPLGAPSPKNEASAAPPLRRKKNNGWIWFFVFIVVASVGVAGLMIWFNLSIQLKPEQLQAARQLWKDQGPQDYRMTYTKRLNDESRVETFVVTVRGGIVQEVLMDGSPLEKQQLAYHRMEALFNFVERFMEIDKKPGHPKVFVTAIFDDKTGALRRYIRRVMGTSQRVEMHFNLEAI